MKSWKHPSNKGLRSCSPMLLPDIQAVFNGSFLPCTMALAGYSGTPLIKKLGIKPDAIVLLINEPADYFKLLETDIREQLSKKNETPDLIHLFVKNNKEFETEMKKLKAVF